MDSSTSDNATRHVLGVPEMDEQHRRLYSLFDQLEQSPTVSDREATKALLAAIEGYLLFHFSSEEHFIRLYKAPGFATHQTDHEQFSAHVVRFLDDFEAGRLNPARFRGFLTAWLMEHSRDVDEEYARVVRAERGV
jgi:hemerythrin